MIFHWLLVVVIIVTYVGSSYGQQYYDSTSCHSSITSLGTRYTCSTSPNDSCETFLIYRTNQDFTTISDVSYLFGILNPDDESLLRTNNVTSSSQILEIGREVIIPIHCSCPGEFFQANVTYITPTNTNFNDVACGVFEGLVKSVTLVQENIFTNMFDNSEIRSGTQLIVPVKCACPDKLFGPGINYLVTYPFISGDDTGKVSEKFNIPVEDIWRVNNMSFNPTVYSNTTILVPLRNEPSINFSIQDSEPPSPGFLPTQLVEKSTKNQKLKKLYISGSIVGFLLLAATLIACGLYVRTLRKFKEDRCVHRSTMHKDSVSSCSTLRSSPPISGPTTTRTSTNSCLSPDLFAGIKYTLGEYNIDELTNATCDFSEETKVSNNVYRGCVDKVEVLIKKIRFEDTRQVIDVHSRINHVSIVKLQGVCYGEDDITGSYLVFEYPSNGTLRDCLSNSSVISLNWHKRTQIAFDIAIGLHYLHFCTIPPYTHMNINSKNVFLTANWRAKLAIFGAKGGIEPATSRDIGSIGSIGGWIAPEHLVHGSVSEKVDIFAFGVVLLELISGKEDVDGNFLRDSITFLGGGVNEGGCFEQLKNFIDPCLKEDYPLAEALCLAVLAKACIEDDPLHRPSMDDIIKVLARMV